MSLIYLPLVKDRVLINTPNPSVVNYASYIVFKTVAW
jgi:hypothetical protein